MIRVKLTTSFLDWPLPRQTPNSSARWGNCQFFINNDIEECDYWVVYDHLPVTEETVCPPDNVVLMTSEPPSVKRYDRSFLSQFAVVLTCDPDVAHPNMIRSHPASPWHVGRKTLANGTSSFSKNYDELVTIGSFEKKKLLSVISSNKADTPGHRLRLRFVQALADHFGERIDIFGRGIREIADKWDAIFPYKYHVTIENSAFPDYWTEKLSDCYLAGAYPIYYGCPNLDGYFSTGAFTRIDIQDVGSAIGAMERVLEENTYERAIREIKHARQLILNKYNIFAVIAEFCEKENSARNSFRRRVGLRPESKHEPVVSRMFRIANRMRSVFTKESS